MFNSATDKQYSVETESTSSFMVLEEAKSLPLSILEKLQSPETPLKLELSGSVPNSFDRASPFDDPFFDCEEAPKRDFEIDRNNPLHSAVIEGNLNLIINLVAANANLFEPSRKKKTVLHCAVLNGNLEILKCLLEASKEQNNLEACLQVRDMEGKSPLHRAVSEQSKLELVNQLLLYGADPNAKDNYGYTPLHWAAKYGHKQIAELLIRYGAEVTSLNSVKETPFDLALRFRQDEVSRLFLGTKWQTENEESGCEDLEKLYYESLVRSKKEGFLEEQIFFLEKLGDIYLNRKDFIKGALIFNTALALSPKETFLEKYLLAKLDRLERQFLKNEKIKRPLEAKNNLSYYRKLLNDCREKCSILYLENKGIYEAGLFKGIALEEEIMLSTSSDTVIDKCRQKLRQQKKHISAVFKIHNQAFRELLIALILDAQENIGEPPCHWACIGMGSMAREEMCPYSDVEFAFLIEESNPKTLNYFRLLTKLVELKIINMGETAFTLFRDSPSITPNGYCMDTGGNTPYGNRDTYELIGTPAELARFQNQKWIDENLILANAMGTVCLVTGNKFLFESYQNEKAAILNQKTWFLNPPLRQTFAILMLEGHLNEFSPNLSKQKEKEDKAFGIKKELYRPFQETISCLALYYNLKSTNTLERVEELMNIGFFCFEGAYYLQYAIRQVLSLRLEAHLFYQDEKEFLCYIEADKPQEEGLLYLDNNRTPRIKAIYSILIPFCEALKKFCITRKKRTMSDCVFYDNMHVQARDLSYGLKTEAAKEIFQQEVSLNPNNLFAINDLCNAEAMLGNKEEALERAYQGLAIIYATEKDNDYLIKTQFITIGKALFNVGKYLEALEYFQKVMDSFPRERQTEEEISSQHLLYAKFGNFSGTCFEEMGDYLLALDQHLLSLVSYLQLSNEQNLNVATCYNNIAFSLSHLGQDKAAENYYETALEILFKFYGEDHHPLIARIYMNMGTHLYGKTPLVRLNKEKALEYYNKALKIYSKFVREEEQAPDPKNLVPNEFNIDSLAMSTSTQQLARNQIATNLWLDEKAIISDTMVEKVNLAKRYLDFIGYELCGIVADENSFPNAFVGSIRCLNEDQASFPESAELISQVKEIIADVSSNKVEDMPDFTKMDSTTIDLIIAKKALNEQNKLYYQAEEYRKSPQGMVNQWDTQNQRWTFGCREITLLANALQTPIRQLIINGNENGYSCLDMLNLPMEEMQTWDEVQGHQRPKEYVYIVDLTGHFLYAKRKNQEIELEKPIGNNYLPLIADNPEHIKIADIYSMIGVLLTENEEYEEGIICFKKALKIYLKFFGDGHSNVAKIYDYIGISLYSQNLYEAGNEYLQEALKIYLSIYGENSLKAARIYKLMGISSHSNTFQKERTLDYLEKALKSQREVLGENHTDVASNYRNIGVVYYELCNYEKALEGFQKALNIHQHVFGEDHPNLIFNHTEIVLVYEKLGNYQQVLKHLKETLNLQLKVFHNNDPKIAITQAKIGISYRKLEKYKKAIVHHSKAIAIHQYNSSLLEEAENYHNIGLCHEKLNDEMNALDYLKKALKIYLGEFGEENALIATSYHAIGVFFENRQNHQKALKYFEKALKIRLRVLNETDLDTAETHKEMGNMYASLDENEKAMEHFQKALFIYCRRYMQSHSSILMALNLLISCARKPSSCSIKITEEVYLLCVKILGREHELIQALMQFVADKTEEDSQYTESELLESCQNDLAVQLKFLGEDHPDVAATYHTMSVVYTNSGKYDEAFKYSEKALKIQLKSLNKKHPDISKSYQQIGYLYQCTKNNKKALDFYQEALKIQLEVLDNNHLELVKIHSSIGSVYESSGNYKKAAEFHQKALQIHLQVVENNHPLLLPHYRTIGKIYRKAGDYKNSLVYSKKALILLSYKPDQSQILKILLDLNICAEKLSPPPLEFLREIYTICEKFIEPEHQTLQRLKELIK